jgi:hypothetical protein
MCSNIFWLRWAQLSSMMWGKWQLQSDD